MQKMYHMSVKIMSRGKGHNFRQKLAYRDGEKYVDEFTGKTVNYQHKKIKDGIENDFIVPEGADESLHNRADYYNALEQKEKAKNAQFYREFEIALPNDMSKEDKKIVAKKFGEELAQQGMFVDINYHKLDSDNPHAHILTSMRTVNEQGLLGNKVREWNDKNKLEEWRSCYAKVINDHYEKLGSDNTVNHESYRRQGKNKVATKKLPVNKRSKEYSDRLKLNKDIRVYNKVLKVNEYQKDLKDLKLTHLDIKQDARDLNKYIAKNPKNENAKQLKKDLRKETLTTYLKIKKRESFISKNQKHVQVNKREVSKSKDRGMSL